MRKFYSAIMALTVLLFASCDKDENGAQTDIGTDTKMSLVISFPETRATDTYATSDEVKVSSVSVFIFNANGTPAKGNLSVSLADFTKEAATNTYTLNAAKKITTTSGAKRIYVGFNLPEDLTDDATAGESNLLAAQLTETDPTATPRLENEFLVTSNGIAMLSQCKEVVLTAFENEGDPTPITNIITVAVERLVAKIAVSKGEKTSFNVGDETHFYTLTPDMFTVGNLAPEYFPAQQKDAYGKLLTPLMIDGLGNTTHTPHLLPQKGLNVKGASVTGLNAYYVPEHATSANNLQGEATYAVVRAQLTFSHFSKVGKDTDGTTDIIVAEENDNSNPATLCVLTNGVTSYFCKTLADATAVSAILDDDTGFGVTEFKYASGYFAFYYVFINRDELSDPLAVYRNTYINMTVNGVNGLGYPGDPDDPTQPPVGPPDPPEPIFKDAYLEIIADVAKWSYKLQDIVLE